MNSRVSADAPAVAVIGLGGYGQTHLHFLRACEAEGLCRIVSAVAVAGTTPAELAALPRSDVRVYPDFDKWLASENGRFDLCCLPTPIQFHERMALAALAAGGSVLVEKPLAASWREVGNLTNVRPSPGRFAAVGFQDLYLAETHALKSALLAGTYGRLCRIKVLGLWPRADTYYARNRWAGRLAAAEGPVLDSPLNNALAHWFMQALFLAGEESGTAAVVTGGDAELYRARAIESFDTAALRLHTRTGVEIVVAMTHSGTVEEAPRVMIETESATLNWKVWHSLHWSPFDGPGTVTSLPSMDATRLRFFAQVCRRAAGEDVFVCSPALAAAHSVCILDLHASCPIHDVPAHARFPAHIGRDPTTEITGIEDTLRRVFATGRLPHELGVSWAQPAARFSASNREGTRST